MAGPAFDSEEVRLWLRILHEGNPGRIHIASTAAWAGPSYPTSDIDGAVARAAALDITRPLGVYVRMTTLMGPLKRGERGGVADSLALPALWADLDIAGPGHKDQNLPPDWRAVVAVIDESRLPAPTLWIDSGHGAYPIWLLSPPHTLTADDIADVSDLSANWQRVIGAASERLGWHYGQGIGDLARVLRIPGTVNRKAGTERMCRLTDGGGGTRYSLAELHEWCAGAMAEIERVHPATNDMRGAPPTKVTSPEVGVPAGSRVGRESPPSCSATPRPEPPRRGPGSGEVSPGDDFAARTSWAEILKPHGWRLVRSRGDISDWCRPGKATGISATTNALGTDRFHVFTTSTDFDTTSYSKFGAFAVLEHGGDHSAAAAALKARGYGTDWTHAVEAYLGGLSDTLPPMPQPADSPPQSAGVGPPDEVLDARTLAELRYRQDVAAEVRRQQINKEARRQVASAEFASTWEEPPSFQTLTEELAVPDEPMRFRINRLLVAEGNAVLTAGFKAGKTTMCSNLLRSLADGDPFLNRFDVEVPNGRVASFNYEVSPGQYKRWLRNIGIKNTDQVCLLNLRGHHLPLTDPQVEEWIVKWLTDRSVKVWIVDPFARAMVGCGDENSNTDVGIVLDILDVIKRRAGVGELILPTHTGRGEQAAGAERARGATRLDDWADARWLLTVDDEARRFFRANGRDVDVDEELLTFDPDTGRLTMGGHDRRALKARDRGNEVVEWVREHPGLGFNEIAAQMGRNRNRTLEALNAAIRERSIYTVMAARNKRLHYATGYTSDGGQEAPRADAYIEGRSMDD